MSELSPDAASLTPEDIVFAILQDWLEVEEAVQRSAHQQLIQNGRHGIEYDPVFLHHTIRSSAETARKLRSILGYRDTMAEIASLQTEL